MKRKIVISDELWSVLSHILPAGKYETAKAAVEKILPGCA